MTPRQRLEKIARIIESKQCLYLAMPDSATSLRDMLSDQDWEEIYSLTQARPLMECARCHYLCLRLTGRQKYCSRRCQNVMSQRAYQRRHK